MATNTSALKSLYPDQTFPAREVVPDALIHQIATVVGSLEGDAPVVRVPYVKADPTASFVPEGDEIDLEDPTLDEISVRTAKIAILNKTSTEAASYAEGNEIVATSLARAVTVKANNALLANPVTSGQPTGLLSLAGIVDGGTLGTDLDVLADAITALEVNGGTATHIVADPASWGAIRNLKTATGSNQPLIGAPADQAERRLFGIPVVVTPQMTAGTLLVVDSNEIIAVAGDIKLATSDQAYFSSDSLARRVTWRLGWTVVNADRIAKVTVTLPTP